jgi:hypothetical protein
MASRSSPGDVRIYPAGVVHPADEPASGVSAVELAFVLDQVDDALDESDETGDPCPTEQQEQDALSDAS